ncbi:hypothetical protein GQ53DRAFT_769706 [Thozetella sp. PMI_491]|nr:hypothetical protein GQ53DRAFT_769706 [Thozetella sp. PMI_491]
MKFLAATLFLASAVLAAEDRLLPPYFPCAAAGGRPSCCQYSMGPMGYSCNQVTPMNAPDYTYKCGSKSTQCCRWYFLTTGMMCQDAWVPTAETAQAAAPVAAAAAAAVPPADTPASP